MKPPKKGLRLKEFKIEMFLINLLNSLIKIFTKLYPISQKVKCLQPSNSLKIDQIFFIKPLSLQLNFKESNFYSKT